MAYASFSLFCVAVVVCSVCGCLCCSFPEFDGNTTDKGLDLTEDSKPLIDLSGCGKLAKTLDSATCYTDNAISKGDASICRSIKNDLMADACIATVAQSEKDESLCSQVSDVSSEYTCLGMVAEAKKDVGLCDLIDNTAYKNPCISKVAVARGEISLCDRLDDVGDKDNCIEDVAVMRKDSSYCSKISGTIDYWRQECVMKVSMAAQDMGLCGSLMTDSKSGEDRMETCVKNITASITNPSECSLVKEESIRDYHCITTVAKAKRDPTVCNMISDEDRKISCVTAIAVQEKDESICEKVILPSNSMRGSYGKNDCIIEAAKAAHNKEFCEKITDNTNAKKTCQKET